MFQSTHPRGVRRPDPYGPVPTVLGFNPRTRVGCDVPTSKWRPCCPACFNPRTRVGCDALTLACATAPQVSIHPPAWGATIKPGGRRPETGFKSQFQSTHPRGVRQVRLLPFPRISLFQSTHPRGVRLCARRRKPSLHLFQSTHPRGVRHDDSHPASSRSLCFNPRTRVGCDINPAFSSAHRLRFNPRTRVGCDPSWVRWLAFWSYVSIHAPAWGATPWLVQSCNGCGLFQSTHPRGVRRGHDPACDRRRRVSIHAPAWGATGGR